MMSFDILGSFDRSELYAALIVGAPNPQIAQLLARVGSLDPTLTPTSVLELYRLQNLNHGARP